MNRLQRSSAAVLLGLALAGLGSNPIQAQSGPLGFGEDQFRQELESDRPDFTEGTQTLQTGHLQLEMGYTFTRDDDSKNEVETHTLPELLLRVGVIEDLELRFTWDGYVSEKSEGLGNGAEVDSKIEGASDMSVGFKHLMYAPRDDLPRIGYIFELGLPVGSDEVTTDEVEPAVKFLWAYDLNECKCSALAGNLNFSAPQGEEERFFETAASLSLSQSLSEQVGGYLEYFGFYPQSGVHEDDTHYLNGGLTWGVTESVQLDIRVGFGLNDAADDFFSGMGIVWRV